MPPVLASAYKFADIPTLLSLIRELADFENALDKVLATEESLAATLSFASPSSSAAPPSAPGYAKALLVKAPDGEVAGMALYFNNYSTWTSAPGIFLEDLFVRPAYRKRGYGKLLISALAREVLDIRGGRLEWSCLRWNETALRFYEGLGAKQMKEWVGLRVDGDDLTKLAKGDPV